MNRVYFFIALAILIIVLMVQFPYALSNTDDKMHLLYSTLLLSVIALSVRNLPLNETLKHATAWIGVFLVIIFAYSFKDEFLNSRIAAELMPNRARMNNDGSFSLRASRDGHFHVEAKVNGVAVNFMIDTGASDIALSKEDAKRIGIDTENLAYTRTYQTANGATGGAPIKLKRLQIGDFILDNFPASVNEGKLNGSLLGMSALRELGGFSVNGEQMIIGKQTN
ncbi:MAG: TIGR02281 family clan AA aspartic protease [Rickettsiales bacterium]